jgi:hypothetical protein
MKSECYGLHKILPLDSTLIRMNPSTTSYPISLIKILILTSHLLLDLTYDIFPLGLRNNILYAFLSCPTHLILLGPITLIICCEQQELWSFSKSKIVVQIKQIINFKNSLSYWIKTKKKWRFYRSQNNYFIRKYAPQLLWECYFQNRTGGLMKWEKTTNIITKRSRKLHDYYIWSFWWY